MSGTAFSGPAPDRASGRAVVWACSPRRGGNTDTAAALLGEAMKLRDFPADAAPPDQLAGPGCVIRRTADAGVQPCVACGSCDTRPGSCPQRDDALPLLRELCAAPAACIVSPIYFYHLPAQAKALIDRAQAFWGLPAAGKPGQGRRLGLVLLGARPRGEKLFAGAVLTLRYMADALGLVPAEALLLYGLDGPDDLRERPGLQARIREYGLALACGFRD